MNRLGPVLMPPRCRGTLALEAFIEVMPEVVCAGEFNGNLLTLHTLTTRISCSLPNFASIRALQEKQVDFAGCRGARFGSYRGHCGELLVSHRRTRFDKTISISLSRYPHRTRAI